MPFCRGPAPERQDTPESDDPELRTERHDAGEPARLRKTLYGLIEPNDTQGPVILQYTGSGSTIQIEGYYDGGMDGGIIERNIERLGLRLCARILTGRKSIDVFTTILTATVFLPIILAAGET